MSVYYADEQVTLHLGDALDVLRTLPGKSVDCIVTSPPYYGLRDYGVRGQYGLEATPAEYVETMRAVFAEAARVLAKDGTLWLNLADTRNNEAAKPHTLREGRALNESRPDGQNRRRDPSLSRKSLLMLPERVALALLEDGWVLRNRIAWHKPNHMPESVADRLTCAHEPVFLFARSDSYFFDLDAIREPSSRHGRGKSWAERRSGGAPSRHGLGGAAAVNDNDFEVNPLGRNPGDMWSIATQPYPEAHFAVFPADLPVRCIKAGCKPGGTVLDPFSGSGTTGGAARLLGRKYVGIDLSAAYHDLAKKRFAQGVLDLGLGEVA